MTPTTTTQRLCICADDFGMSPGVNAAVLDLVAQRKLSATGCMVQREAWRAGAAALGRADAAQVDVGLHLDLTPPVAAGGEEPGLGPLLLRSYTQTASGRRLRHAIAEQLSRFEDGMGRAPAFVDGHRHVHQFPVVRRVLLDELARRYPHALPWVRNTRPRILQGADARKARLIHALGGRALVREAARRSFAMNGALLGVYDFRGGHDGYRTRMAGWLATARSGDLLMCHPSAGDAPATPHDAARKAEYAVLSATQFPWTSPTGDSVVVARLSFSQTLP